MTKTLSIRLDAETKKHLEALAGSTKRSRSFLAAEAIERYVEIEEWQVDGIGNGIADLDAGYAVSHEKVTKWLESWGTPAERKAPL